MQCPKCGYLMEPTDLDCPRCVKMAAVAPPVAGATPQNPVYTKDPATDYLMRQRKKDDIEKDMALCAMLAFFGGMVICAFAWLPILLLTQHSFDGGGLETIIGTAIVFFFVVRWIYRALLKRGKQ